MTRVSRILLVDDEPLMRIPLSDRMTRAGYVVVAVGSAEEAIAQLGAEDFDVAVVDLRLPGKDGLSVLKEIQTLGCPVDPVVITAHGTIDAAVDAMKLGARDFLTKPFQTETLLALVERYIRVRRARYEATDEAGGPSVFSGIIGASPPMLELYRLIDAVADGKATVIVQGETGSGKELVANAIHERSPRRTGPLVKVNCASIPEPLFESELFGFERGAFTGADRRHKGKFEIADGGSLFLDEIDEMPLGPQAKLLRVLQEHEIERLGGAGAIALDVRVVAATKCDLAERVGEGRFREDLFYRLNVLPILLPPLRDRGDDVELLAQRFLEQALAESPRQALAFSQRALAALRAHRWPGNVRELKNVVARAVTLCPKNTIEPAHLMLKDVTPSTPPRARGALAETLHEAEERSIREALAQTGGHKGRAAQLLGISRKTLWEKLNRRRG